MPDIFDASRRKTKTTTTTVESETVAAKPRVKRHVDDYSDVLRAESPATNPFNAFSAKPHHIFFDTQMADEKVLLLLRRHPITQIPWMASAIVLAVLPFVVISLFPVLAFLPIRYELAAMVGWYALVFSFVLESFLMWFFNVYIITDERVIDVDFNSLIYKNISSAKLDNIEDITATTGGAIRSLFDFGTIKIQTAAANTEFEFEDVPHSGKVQSLINELLVEEEREKLEGRVN